MNMPVEYTLANTRLVGVRGGGERIDEADCLESNAGRGEVGRRSGGELSGAVNVEANDERREPLGAEA